MVPWTVLSARTSSSRQVNFCSAVRAGSESAEERRRAERSNRSSIYDLETRRNNARRLLPQSLDADSDGDCAAVVERAMRAAPLLFFPDASAPPKVSQMSYTFKSGGLFYDVRCSIPSYQVSFRLSERSIVCTDKITGASRYRVATQRRMTHMQIGNIFTRTARRMHQPRNAWNFLEHCVQSLVGIIRQNCLKIS